MICGSVCLLVLLGHRPHKFEPLLLLPIGFGAVLRANIPLAGMNEPGGGCCTCCMRWGHCHQALFPLLIFLGVGAGQ